MAYSQALAPKENPDHVQVWNMPHIPHAASDLELVSGQNDEVALVQRRVLGHQPIVDVDEQRARREDVGRRQQRRARL